MLRGEAQTNRKIKIRFVYGWEEQAYSHVMLYDIFMCIFAPQLNI